MPISPGTLSRCSCSVARVRRPFGQLNFVYTNFLLVKANLIAKKGENHIFIVFIGEKNKYSVVCSWIDSGHIIKLPFGANIIQTLAGPRNKVGGTLLLEQSPARGIKSNANILTGNLVNYMPKWPVKDARDARNPISQIWQIIKMQTTLTSWTLHSHLKRNRKQNQAKCMNPQKIYIYQKYILQLYFTSAAKFFAFCFLRQGFFQRIGGTKCSRQKTNGRAGQSPRTWPIRLPVLRAKSSKLAQSIKLINSSWT